MKFKEFLKDRLKTIILIMFAIITTQIFLLIYDIHMIVRIYIAFVPILMYLIGIYIDYLKERNFYDKLNNNLEQLEEKYLISAMIDKPEFIEGKILNDIIEQINKSMIENVNKYKYIQEEYKEYVELWIHEVKLPIATSKMIIENNQNEITDKIEEELSEIEDYVEQALFYARSNDVEKDYYIIKTDIKSIVNESIKKNKQALINQKIKIETSNLEKEIYTDPKWCHFILNQIIQNSIKYKKEQESEIEFCAEDKKDNVILYIKDNGIGIKKSEILRVFDKSFTGTNGRMGKKSTGLGLHLCKKLCNKLGIGIEINSKENIGTEIRIIFPKNSYIEMN